jgi:hypothetical protein
VLRGIHYLAPPVQNPHRAAGDHPAGKDRLCFRPRR